MKTWVKAFGLVNVAPQITLAKNIWAGLESHFNSVQCKGCSVYVKENDYGSGGNLQKRTVS